MHLTGGVEHAAGRCKVSARTSPRPGTPRGGRLRKQEAFDMDFSFQLYSARNFPPLDRVLGRLAELGYAQVEGYGGLYDDAEGLAASLRQHGLAMPTGHFGLAQLKDTSNAMRTAE